GLLDYSTHQFKPALQVDFNRHQLKRLTIRDNRDAGLGIMWNDVFTSRDQLAITSSEMSNNWFHGIITRSQGLRLQQCQIFANKGSGFHYEPMFTNWEQKDLVT